MVQNKKVKSASANLYDKIVIMNILALESSCDETAAAVVSDGKEILSNVIASQVEIHAKYGGVVPEVAARSHVEVIIPVIEQALSEADLDWNDIDTIAVTRGPGLVGSLLIGVLTAQTLAITKQKPLIGVNHIWAHAFASFLDTRNDALSKAKRSRTGQSIPQFPFLALTVSGGHTTLSVYQEDLSREVLGQTLDDAAGEAFDKVAKLIGLGYPGGPAISEAAESGDDTKYKFPIANTPGPYDFSFSGLKTAVLRQVQQITGVNPGSSSVISTLPSVILSEVEESHSNQTRSTPMRYAQGDKKSKLKKTYQLDKQVQADLAASFQNAAVDALVQKTLSAYNDIQPKAFVVGGGVACNTLLRERLKQVIPDTIVVPPVLCTDNAAMIGAIAHKMAERNLFTKPEEIVADPSLEIL
jgi:N6-L-threonylcarbamoyladenine synthase